MPTRTSTLQTDGRTTYDSNTALALRASRGSDIWRTRRVREEKQIEKYEAN